MRSEHVVKNQIGAFVYLGLAVGLYIFFKDPVMSFISLNQMRNLHIFQWFKKGSYQLLLVLKPLRQSEPAQERCG